MQDTFYWINNNLNNCLLIDKIGLRIPTEILNREKAHEFHEDKPVTILIQNQDVSEICIHDQWLPYLQNHFDRTKYALQYLFYDGVFKRMPENYSLVELEIAFDIYYKNTIFVFSNFAFYNYKGTFYTRKDYRKDWRLNEFGKSLSKGVHDSFLKYYDNGFQLGFNFPYYRLEFRFQGKYKKQLQLQYLNGNSFDVLRNYYPFILNNCKKLFNAGEICVTIDTMQSFTQEFKVLLYDMGVKTIVFLGKNAILGEY
jgi:hypothetical protein